MYMYVVVLNFIYIKAFSQLTASADGEIGKTFSPGKTVPHYQLGG